MFHRDRFDGSPKGRAMRRWVVVVALACLALAACGEEPVMGSNVADPTTSTSSALDTPTFDRAAAEAEIRSQYDKYIKATTDITTKDHVEQKTFMKGLVTDEVNKEELEGLDGLEGGKYIKKNYPTTNISNFHVEENKAEFNDCYDERRVYGVEVATGKKTENAADTKTPLERIYIYQGSKWLLAETQYGSYEEICS